MSARLPQASALRVLASVATILLVLLGTFDGELVLHSGGG
jgi:hypothetical protein